MGNEYARRPFFSPLGMKHRVSTVTLSTAVQTLNPGLNLVVYGTSGVAADALLPEPSFVGEEITVVLNNGTTSLEANINTHATSSVFYGTTFNTATVATTAADPPTIQFIAASTSQWALFQGTTASWTLAGTTGSTGQ